MICKQNWPLDPWFESLLLQKDRLQVGDDLSHGEVDWYLRYPSIATVIQWTFLPFYQIPYELDARSLLVAIWTVFSFSWWTLQTENGCERNSLSRIMKYLTVITYYEGDKQTLTHSFGERAAEAWLILGYYNRIAF